MIINLEKMRKDYYISTDKNCEMITLADLENLKEHLEYFIDNEHVDSMGIKIGEDDDVE